MKHKILDFLKVFCLFFFILSGLLYRVWRKTDRLNPENSGICH